MALTMMMAMMAMALMLMLTTMMATMAMWRRNSSSSSQQPCLCLSLRSNTVPIARGLSSALRSPSRSHPCGPPPTGHGRSPGRGHAQVGSVYAAIIDYHQLRWPPITSNVWGVAAPAAAMPKWAGRIGSIAVGMEVPPAVHGPAALHGLSWEWMAAITSDCITWTILSRTTSDHIGLLSRPQADLCLLESVASDLELEDSQAQ